MKRRSMFSLALFAICSIAQSSNSQQYLPNGVKLIVSSPASGTDIVSVAGKEGASVFIGTLNVNTVELSKLYLLPPGTEIRATFRDDKGSIYGVGSTTNPDFPITSTIGSPKRDGRELGFVLKIDSSGTLQYSLLIGGRSSQALHVASDPLGEALISGTINDPDRDFPETQAPLGASASDNSGFLLKLDPSGLTHSVALRGLGLGPVAYDLQGNIIVSGAIPGGQRVVTTESAFQKSFERRPCAGTAQLGLPCNYQYVAKLYPDGTKFHYSTYLTGSHGAQPKAMLVLEDGSIMLAGVTNSTDYPVTEGTLQVVNSAKLAQEQVTAGMPIIVPPPQTAFISKIDGLSGQLAWSTYFGGTGSDSIESLALYDRGGFLIAGFSASDDLPGAERLPKGCTPTFSNRRAFAARISDTGDRVLASAFLPESGQDDELRVLVQEAKGAVVLNAKAITSLGEPYSTPQQCTFDPADNVFLDEVVPGQLVTVRGSLAIDSESPLQVVFGDSMAQIVYSDSQQINFRVPDSLNVNEVVSLHVKQGNRDLLVRNLRISGSAPAVFLDLLNYTPTQTRLVCREAILFDTLPAIVLNSDGSLNNCERPSVADSLITVFVNGLGARFPTIEASPASKFRVESIGKAGTSASDVWIVKVRVLEASSAATLELRSSAVPIRSSRIAIFSSTN